MLTWFQAGFLWGKNPYTTDLQGRVHSDPADHFLFCTGAETVEDYVAFCAGVEAHREIHDN